MSLQGKRALITGGSAGLGAAIAVRLAAEGAICAINFASNAERAAGFLSTLPGGNHCLIRGSVFSKPEAQRVVLDAAEQLSGLDIVVSNAGWTKFGLFNDLDSVSDSDWDACYTANVKSHLWVMQAARSELAVNKGSFLITASVAGIRPSGSSMAYAVSKAAAIHLSASLAKACAPDIVVNSISPGVLQTDWSKGFTNEALAATKSANALGDLARVDDCADMAAALLRTRSVTGQNLEISAGFRL